MQTDDREADLPETGRHQNRDDPPDLRHQDGTNATPDGRAATALGATSPDSGRLPPIAVLEPKLARSGMLLAFSVLLTVVTLMPGALATFFTFRATMASRAANHALQAGQIDHANILSHQAAKLRKHGGLVLAGTAALAAAIGVWMTLALSQLS